MSLNNTPSANRTHIAFFGRINAGKSSLVNAVTGQSLSIVSDYSGTTTDPVLKSMEILPLGAVVIIDTPGFDDVGELGEKRVKKTMQILAKTDIAILVVDATIGLKESDDELLSMFKKRNLPYIIAFNKCDLLTEYSANDNEIYVSAEKGININELKEKIASMAKPEDKKLIGDILDPNDLVILVTPIDESAPKGRLILPQQQTLRDVLDSNAVALVTKENEYKNVLDSISVKPRIVITDSQVFGKISRETPEDIALTSFSIVFARYKGILYDAVLGAKAIEKLKNGNKILISEGCTHHRQCNDIGTVKMPKWIEGYTGKKLEFTYTSGTEFPEDLEGISLVVHCGGCMLNEKEMKFRMEQAKLQHVPFTNYGTIISYMNGILERTIKPFSELKY